MIDRAAAPKIKQLAGQFKAVAIIGPRQSGKTTLALTLPENASVLIFLDEVGSGPKEQAAILIST